MKVPGTFLMRAVVRDATNHRIGSASQYVQVPDTRKKQLALSGIVLQLAPPDVLGKLARPPATPPSAQADSWRQGGPALRRYLPGQTILYGFAVINAKMKSGPQEFKAGYLLRVFRNGKLLYEGPFSNQLVKGQGDPTSLIGGGVLTLVPQIPPGEYLMQVLVTDELAPRKRSQVAQWVDFEVLNPAQTAHR
jgi:hypothetical protein